LHCINSSKYSAPESFDVLAGIGSGSTTVTATAIAAMETAIAAIKFSSLKNKNRVFLPDRSFYNVKCPFYNLQCNIADAIFSA
jgi:hypothetical protein